MAPAISKPLVSDLVAQIGKVPLSHHITPAGDDRLDLANVDNNKSGAGIPLNKLSGPERRKVAEGIGRACESDGFFMVTNHGIPAGVVDDPNKAIRLSTSFNVHTEELSNWRDFLLSRLHCHPLESFVHQKWPSNPPSSRAACTVWRENIHRAVQRCVHRLGCSNPSYYLPITQARPSRMLRRPISAGRRTSFPAADPQPGPYGSESRFSPPPFILQKNDVKVEVMITDEATTDEDVSKLDLVIMAAPFSLLVPMAINLDYLTSSWGTPWKDFYSIFLMVSLASTSIGLFTGASSRTRSLSPLCARFGLVLATALLLLLIASKLGRFGCAAGVALAALLMLVLAVIWICSEQPTAPEI